MENNDMQLIDEFFKYKQWKDKTDNIDYDSAREELIDTPFISNVFGQGTGEFNLRVEEVNGSTVNAEEYEHWFGEYVRNFLGSGKKNDTLDLLKGKGCPDNILSELLARAPWLQSDINELRPQYVDQTIMSKGELVALVVDSRMFPENTAANNKILNDYLISHPDQKEIVDGAFAHADEQLNKIYKDFMNMLYFYYIFCADYHKAMVYTWAAIVVSREAVRYGKDGGYNTGQIAMGYNYFRKAETEDLRKYYRWFCKQPKKGLEVLNTTVGGLNTETRFLAPNMPTVQPQEIKFAEECLNV